MSVAERGGVGGLAIEQNEAEEEGVNVHAALDVETSLEDGCDVEYTTLSNVDENGPYEFVIPKDMDCFFVPSLTRVNGKFKVQKVDGTSIEATDKVTLANLSAACLFEQVEVYFNGTQVNDLSAPAYPFKHFIETYLSYNTDVKNSFLRCEGYTDETPDEVDLVDFSTAALTSSGGRKRSRWIALSKSVPFSMRLAVDVFQAERFLPPNIDIKIKFIRSSRSFGLIYAGETVQYKIVLEDLRLQMRKVLPAQAAKDRYFKRLEVRDAYIPYKSTRLRGWSIGPSVTSYTVTNVVTGVLPKMLIMCFVEGKAYNGTPNKNPFNFVHCNLNFLQVMKNGQSIFPRAIKPDFVGGAAMSEYRQLFDAIGIAHSNNSNGLTYEHFLKGKTFFAVDLNPDKCGNFHTHTDSVGNLNVEMRFSTALANAIQFLCYSVYNGGIKINNKLQVIKAHE